MSTTLLDQAIDSMQRAAENGPRYFPAARYITVLGIDINGDTTGAAADICPGCVSEVADQSLEVMRGKAQVPYTGSDLGKPGYLGDGAMAQVGPQYCYEMAGCNDVNPDDPCICAQCHGEY